MLDEPSLGLAPVLVDRVYERLTELKRTGLTMLLVEQSIQRAQTLADRLCLLRTGEIVACVAATDEGGVAELASRALGDERTDASTKGRTDAHWESVHDATGAQDLEQCLNLQPGEELLVLTDTDKMEYAEIFTLIGREMGAEVSMLAMAPRSRHSEVAADSCFGNEECRRDCCPYHVLGEAQNARTEASRAGARLIFLPDINDVIFRDGSLDIDFWERKGIIDQVAKVLDGATRIDIRSVSGTHMTASIAGKRAVPQTGICHEPG